MKWSTLSNAMNAGNSESESDFLIEEHSRIVRFGDGPTMIHSDNDCNRGCPRCSWSVLPLTFFGSCAVVQTSNQTHMTISS